jgi:hypothetical protein
MTKEEIIKLKRKVEAEGFAPVGIWPEVLRLCELVAEAEREACGRVKAAKPRKLKPVGSGMLLDEQQYCFEKGWREGAASVRAAIRAKGN